MDFSQQFSVVTYKLSINTKDTFESDENDFDVGFFFSESDELEDMYTGSNILPQLESTLINGEAYHLLMKTSGLFG